MTDLETKRKHIETAMKILGLGALCLILGPVYLTLIHGLGALIALGIAAAGAFVVINLLPSFAAMVANWRLKAIKAVAAANPIETLENQYAERQNALIKIRDNIKEFYAVVQELWSQIQEHNEKYPNNPSQFLEKYNKMKDLLALRSNKYKMAQANLKAFSELIDEKRSDWKVAQAAAKAMKLANVGEDFNSKLMADTALTTIQDGLNFAFSELEVSLLDEQPIPTATTVTVAPKTTKKLADKAGPPPLDLVFNEEQPESASIPRRQKIVTS